MYGMHTAQLSFHKTFYFQFETQKFNTILKIYFYVWFKIF